MSEKHDFIVKTEGELTAKDLRLDMSFQGQQGDMLINGKNRWHFGVLLKPPHPMAVGANIGFSYTGDFVKYLNTGENVIEYTPKRQEGAPDHEQGLDLIIGFPEDTTFYEVHWRVDDLADGDKKVIRFLIEEEGIKEIDKPKVDDDDLELIKTHEFISD